MYKITFIDNKTFEGGNITNSKWNLMPLKPIKSLEYHLMGQKILLQGYEAYNHLIERTVMLGRGERINKLILMAKKEENILKLIFNFTKNKFKYDVAEFGKEYRGQSTTGWKEGIIGDKPRCQIL